MSVYENFFIAGEDPPRDAARDIAAALNMTITVEDGGLYLWRFNADGPGSLGGEIFKQRYRCYCFTTCKCWCSHTYRNVAFIGSRR